MRLIHIPILKTISENDFKFIVKVKQNQKKKQIKSR